MAPDVAFRTLERQRAARNPPANGHEYPALQRLTAAHVDSFNALCEPPAGPSALAGGGGLLELAVADIGVKAIFDRKGAASGASRGNKLLMWIEDVQVGRPMVPDRDKHSRNRLIYPAECRERGVSYCGKLMAKVCWSVNDGPVNSESRQFGLLPVMVRGNRCNLHGMSSAELIARREEGEEMGGYFIMNGNERIVRLVIAPRRNHAMAIIRPSYASRGPAYTQFGVQIRSVRPDQSSQTVTLHYLSDGQVVFRFSWRKQEYLVPVVLILKSLLTVSDAEICDDILRGEADTWILERVEGLLRAHKSFGVYTRDQCLAYLGDKFRVVLGLPEDFMDREIGEALLRKVVLVHLDARRDKYNLLVYMIQKLYALASGTCCADNVDSTQFHEILLPGHLYANIIKEKFEDFLNGFRSVVQQDLRRNSATVDFLDNKYIIKTLNKSPGDIGQKLQYFVATGNLVTGTGLDQQQMTGFTIVAEKLNFYRYLAHFRCVHRGAFFATLKTTTVRKLLPEAWGFMCPVHTPDGAPCGLLNHLSHSCEVVATPSDVSRIPALLASLGVAQTLRSARSHNVTVQLDGKVVGWCTPVLAKTVADALRLWKLEGNQGVPLQLEIALVRPSRGGQFPGLYLFSEAARMTRPVVHLATGKTDYVGPFEQVYLDIACTSEEALPGVTTHLEETPTNILSVIANLTPFSDFNQSPRNMYQCQMGKQTMGTPGQALAHRTDNKMYRLQTGQTPIVRPALHERYGVDGGPNGTNAIVAVISYTGYDMEDAMIINKSAHERGFGYGSVYKSEWVDLGELRQRHAPIMHHFGVAQGVKREVLETVDLDGLPIVGVKLVNDSPMYAYIDDTTGRTVVKRYKGMEDAYVDQVRLLGSDTGEDELQRIQIKLRIPRPPIIGDKFSSRHGQKGVCSQKYPAVDLPFSESGMQPDVIINPHAFPSRMTIGMFVESIAAKSGALHGIPQDATPFTFSEQHTAADYFGEQLLKAGYNYHGDEPMYSGVTGEEFKADIYIGVVYYQRLRHMVSDKYQVRTTGPVHNLTQQPLKGRKRAGGIRFGEMERDSLLAHGVSYLLQDRLMNCSDYSQAHVCKLCGSIVSAVSVATTSASTRREVECRVCGTSRGIDLVAVPYVFRYLATELMAMNIKLTLEVTSS